MDLKSIVFDYDINDKFKELQEDLLTNTDVKQKMNLNNLKKVRLVYFFYYI